MHYKAPVAAATLALGTGQCVFLMRVGVQKNGKVPPDRQVALRHHLLGRGPDHHPIPVLHRQAEQMVTHRAADEIGLHRGARPYIL